MDFRYYKDIPTTSYVWFKLLDGLGKEVENFPDSACYSVIAHGFDKRAKQIHIYHEKAKIPYSIDCIKRWINDLNEMGFPCSFINDESPDDPSKKSEQFAKTTINDGLIDMALLLMRHGNEPPGSPDKFHNFYVELDKYEDKNYLFSTLSLVRCLTESGICKIPEVYFNIIDENPGIDKLEACQNAHKKVSGKNERYDPRCYANTGHMITFDGNGTNVTRESLMARFKKAKVDLRDPGSLKINASWNGSK